MDLLRITLWLSFLGILLLGSATGQRCQCHDSKFSGRNFALCSCRKSWSEAEQYCGDQYDGRLAAILDNTTQAGLASFLSDYNMEDTWVGAKGSTGPWRWVDGGETVVGQGCYRDDPISRDLSFEVTLDSVTHETCTEECRMSGYDYAATQAGSFCYCGDSYGDHGAATDCNFLCSGNEEQRCGGPFSSNIFSTEGDPLNKWGLREPKIVSGFDDHECMSMKCDYNDAWIWEAKRCSTRQRFLCKFDPVNGACKEGKLLGSNMCLWNEGTRYDTWFGARMHCKQMGGQLLEMTHQDIYDKVTSSMECWEGDVWLGGTKINWSWNSGDSMFYTIWASGAPSNEGEKCVAMSYRLSSSYEWSDATCNQGLNFVCEKDTKPTTTTTSTTTSTTTPSTTTTPTTTPTTTRRTTTTTPLPTMSRSTSTPGFPSQSPTLSFTAKPSVTSTTPSPYPSSSSRSTSISTPIMPSISVSGTHSPALTSSGTQPPGVTTQPSTRSTTPGQDTTKGTDEPKPGVGGLTQGAWIGIGVAIAAFVILLIITAVCVSKRRRRSKMHDWQTAKPPTLENGFTTKKRPFMPDDDFAYVNAKTTKDLNGSAKPTPLNSHQNDLNSLHTPNTQTELQGTPVNAGNNTSIHPPEYESMKKNKAPAPPTPVLAVEPARLETVPPLEDKQVSGSSSVSISGASTADTESTVRPSSRSHDNDSLPNSLPQSGTLSISDRKESMDSNHSAFIGDLSGALYVDPRKNQGEGGIFVPSQPEGGPPVEPIYQNQPPTNHNEGIDNHAYIDLEDMEVEATYL